MQLHRLDRKDRDEKFLTLKNEGEWLKEYNTEWTGCMPPAAFQSLFPFHLPLLDSFLLAFTRFLPLCPPCFLSSSSLFVQKAHTVLLQYPVQRGSSSSSSYESLYLIHSCSVTNQNLQSGFKSSQVKYILITSQNHHSSSSKFHSQPFICTALSWHA